MGDIFRTIDRLLDYLSDHQWLAWLLFCVVGFAVATVVYNVVAMVTNFTLISFWFWIKFEALLLVCLFGYRAFVMMKNK